MKTLIGPPPPIRTHPRTRTALRTRLRRAGATLFAVLAALLAVQAPAAHANVPGNVLYAPASSTEGMAYVRMIRLAHSGSADGTLLATFEHWNTDGTQSDYIIKQSTNDGASWSTLSTVAGDTFSYQPFLFEYPQQLGNYPAGTLLLVGATLPANRAGVSFREWRSSDHGATWSSVGVVQTSPGADGDGIWEPFVGLDNAGNMVMYFSDERQNATYSQFLGHMISTDGGNTWSANLDGSTKFAPGEVKDVASTIQADRPGMVTIARIATTGEYVMSYELCGPANCSVHYKTSSDGDTWGSGPTDTGTMAQTSDGRYLEGTPVLTWSAKGGPNGELLLSGHDEVRSAGGAPENQRIVLVNTNAGSGSWSWMPSPIAVPTAGGNSSQCGLNYSPDLLVSADGTAVRYSAAGAAGTYNCEELTGSANAGVLPDTADFSAGDGGWDQYSGTFTTSGGVYSETVGGTGGNKSVTGSTGWTNYDVTADVRLNAVGSNGNAGLLVRATDPTGGTDSVDAYYVGVSTSSVIIGKESYGWTQLASGSIPGGLAAGSWYHLTIGVTGCEVTVQGEPAGTNSNPVYLAVNDCSFAAGAVGVRDYNTTASWRDIKATPAGAIGGPGGTGECVDDNTNTNASGNAVQLWTCNGVPGQQWSALADGTIRAYGKCLDVAGDASGNFSKVILNDCDGTGGEQWTPRPDGSLYNPQSGRCLDDPSGVTSTGTQLQIYDCNGLWTQQWSMPS